MDEQNYNDCTARPEAQSQVVEGEGFVMHSVSEQEETNVHTEPVTEQPAQNAEELPPQEPKQESTFNTQTSQWQGGYSYKNPNPYQKYENGAYQAQSQKKSNGVLIAAITAACIFAVCCVLMLVAQFVGVEPVRPSDDPVVNAPSQQEDPGKTENTNNAQRDDEVVYNMPDISPVEKSGETLSIVEINKKMKNSVVAILVATGQEKDTDFSGSGFIISQDGYIITNAHVIENATTVEVVLIDGITSYNATIVGQDERSDLAILKIDATGLSPAELGNSDQLEEGEEVVCIGNPYGMELSGSITNGIVSALNRKIEMSGGYMTLIQTNAEINPGNSGGPLINGYGQVVGITSSKLVATGYEGIGFAIPINDAIALSEELINYGYVKSRAYIGFSGNDLTEAYAKYHKLPQGVYVVYVNEGSDAEKKGLKEEDIVIGFNDTEIKSMAELNDLKDNFHPGDTVTITVWRDGETFDLKITLTGASE